MEKPDQNPVNADSLIKAARQIKSRGPAPVHLWNPDYCGEMDMRIARDGTWFYMGTPIGRKPLVKLFANILRRDGDDYFLVTPVEKVGITVEDAPFVAVDFEVTGQGKDQILTFTTQTDDVVRADADHPIRVQFQADTPSPYVLVRTNLEALIDRKSFYRLVELGVTHLIDGQDWFGVWSAGTFFPLARASGLSL